MNFSVPEMIVQLDPHATAHPPRSAGAWLRLHRASEVAGVLFIERAAAVDGNFDFLFPLLISAIIMNLQASLAVLRPRNTALSRSLALRWQE